jgi:hypothetical protein
VRGEERTEVFRREKSAELDWAAGWGELWGNWKAVGGIFKSYEGYKARWRREELAVNDFRHRPMECEVLVHHPCLALKYMTCWLRLTASSVIV